MTTCIRCGCTDEKACEGGCWWVIKNLDKKTGICSQCAGKAKFIGITFTRGKKKHKWECPYCRQDKPESRFNLSPDKDGKTHKCRFCGNELLLEK